MTGLTAVAMSGGLDSSVTALLLARGGRPLIGLSMLLWEGAAEEAHGRCCAPLDLADARRVARRCGIPHYTLRMEEAFRRAVVDPFVEGYLAGRTPVPCTRCNSWIKFDLFLERARDFGAERMATGHYARIVEGPDGPELHAARDRDKDQSYYLFELTREQLAASEFPLGELTKAETRELASEADLLVAGKGESMELCFVAGGVREFVEEQLAQRPGAFSRRPPATGAEVVATDGTPLGRGEPYYRYTVGQRRGLGVTASERLYVLGIEPGANRVTVGGAAELMAGGLAGGGAHWIAGEPAAEIEATVRIRARHAGVRSRVRALRGGRVEVEFAEPQRGVTPGQAAVFYEGSRVLGGCWIGGGPDG